MDKLIQRVRNGFRERPGSALFYAFLIYMMLAVALWLASPYFPGSSPDSMSREEEFQGNLLTLSIAAFALGLSGWIVGGAK